MTPREHYCGEFKHPLFKSLSGRQVAADNQPQHVGLRKHAHILSPAGRLKGVAFHHPLAMLLHGVVVVGVADGEANILPDEQEFSGLVGDDSDLVGFKLERGDLFHGRSYLG